MIACNHTYLNKWDGDYICMKCSYKFDRCSDIDRERINVEERLEATTGVDNSYPGVSLGEASRRRGVSIGFLLQFTKDNDCWQWNSWDVILRIIKPQTEATRCRYVELDWMKEHVGPANTFISYAQAGIWGDIVAAVVDGDADRNRKIWLDVFAVRQWPSSSPDLDFASTIECCNSFLIVCSSLEEVKKLLTWDDIYAHNTKKLPIAVRKKISFLRVWCLVEIAKAAMIDDMPIIMKGGSHLHDANEDTVTFIPDAVMLRRLSYLIDITNAEATVQSDKDVILSNIKQTIGVDHLNHIVRGVISGARGFALLENSAIVGCASCGDRNALAQIFSDKQNSILAVAAGGFESLLIQLLNYGDGDDVDVNAKGGKAGMTALMHACKGGHAGCAKMLINHGAIVNLKDDRYGHTALMEASMGGHEECMTLLLKHEANVNILDNKHMNAFMWAAKSGYVECCRQLVKEGADCHQVSIDGYTAIMEAAEGGHHTCVDFLIAQSVNLDAQDFKHGKTALIYSCKAGQNICAEKLVDCGASMNIIDNNGNTALMHSIIAGNEACCVALLIAGADANIIDLEGRSALSYATTLDKNNFVQLLMKYSAALTP